MAVIIDNSFRSNTSLNQQQNVEYATKYGDNKCMFVSVHHILCVII